MAQGTVHAKQRFVKNIYPESQLQTPKEAVIWDSEHAEQFVAVEQAEHGKGHIVHVPASS